MDDATAIWSYYQEIVDELQQSLVDKTIEMEAFKKEANEKLKKSKDDMNQLLRLLKVVCHERDEARSNLSDYSIESSSSNNNLMQTIHVDRASLFIENAANRKPLPQKGRLLKAVLESGPLLQTLLVTGPMPRWRNPPPMFPVPQVLDGGSVPRTEFPRSCCDSKSDFQIGNMLKFHWDREKG